MGSLLPPPPSIARPRLPSFVDVEPHATASKGVPWGLALGALGVVYGDLGTNPLFALGEAFGGEHPVGVNRVAILGVLSLIFWSITLVVAVKYLGFVMRASNDGEGGILALLSQIPQHARVRVLVLVVLFGAALLYGDGVVTPAISVLSAVEGLKTAAPSLAKFIVPITMAILVVLFSVQKRGTQDIGFVFGPIMTVWFLVIGALGASGIARAPILLTAVSPTCAIRYALAQPHDAFMVLGAVILCIAGSEDLYADMGHFGRKPIALAFGALVFPALVLNYFGQGALMLSGGKPEPSAFYALVPHALLVPMIVLSTAATVIASQALISGAYSLTQQAVQLGFAPRVTVVHTCAGKFGQIYVPEVNWALMVMCLALVAGFRTSDRLASAYGMAVTGTMTVTSIAFFVVVVWSWRWPLYKALPLCALFLNVDLLFLSANLRKFWDGGWIPFSIGLAVFTLFTTWVAGRARLGGYLQSMMVPLDAFLDDVHTLKPHRVRGTAVFLTGHKGGVPTLMLHHFKHNQILHETVVLLTITSEHAPFVKPADRIATETLREGFYRVVARFGYMEAPSVPALMEAVQRSGAVPIDMDRLTYYVGRETMIPTGHGLRRLRMRLFALITRNALPATAYFGIPPNRVVELGMQIEL